MDIQINAGPRGGKTHLATDLARNFTGQRYAHRSAAGVVFWVDTTLYASANVVLSKITRAVIESRCDLVVLDDVPIWAIRHVKDAVQIARNSLRRNILAIYCVQDLNAGIDSPRPFIPAGFVNDRERVPAFEAWTNEPETFAIDKDEVKALDPDTVDKLKNVLRGQPSGVFIPDGSVFGITEESVGVQVEAGIHDEIVVRPTRTKQILLDMAREIHASNALWIADALREVLLDFGADSVDALTPDFYPTAHDAMLPLVYKARLYRIIVTLAKKGKASDVRKLLDKYNARQLRDLDPKFAGALLADIDAELGQYIPNVKKPNK